MPVKPKASDSSETANRVASELTKDEQPLGSAGSRRVKLTELITQFKPEHRHGEWDLGDPVGHEVW